MKEVLVSGAGGFIGGHIVSRCVIDGCFVRALVHKNIPLKLKELEKSGRLKIYQADIRSYEQLSKIFKNMPRLDALIHCAGKASDTGRERDFKAINYEAVKHLVKMAKVNDTRRFTFISTTDVYGLHDFNGQTEDELAYEASPSNPYPKYKIMAEKYIKAEFSPEKYSIIRPAAVWGDDDPTLTARIKQFLSISPFIIHFGSWKGKNRWPLAKVENVALAAYLASFSDQAKGQAISVLDEQYTTIDAFYRQVAAKFFPKKKFRTICLPMWCGIAIGAISTVLSNMFNAKKPIWDPTLYALYSVSRNLDFSSARFKKLIEFATSK